MTTYYKEVPLSSNNWSKEDIEYLVGSTLTLMAKKRITLKAQTELQMVIDCLQEDWQCYVTCQEKAGQQQSDSLKELDRQRDLDFSDLLYGLRAQLRSRQANRQQAAQIVYEIVEGYKGMRHKPQAEQSADMKEFFKIMDKPDNQAKLTLTGTMEFYTHLKASQAKFETAYFKRMEERGQRQQATKDQARQNLVKTYRMVYRYLNCLEFFGKTTAHKELLATFNAARLSFKDIQARKAGQAKKKTKTGEPLALLEEPLDDVD